MNCHCGHLIGSQPDPLPSADSLARAAISVACYAAIVRVTQNCHFFRLPSIVGSWPSFLGLITGGKDGKKNVVYWFYWNVDFFYFTATEGQ